jgi:deoxyribodipyrimidine photolyase-related protein
MTSLPRVPLRHLVVVLGDQLDLAASALEDFDPTRDVVWMAEVAGEATAVWSGRARIALFLAAMRHHRETLRAAGHGVDYIELDDPANTQTLAGELARALAHWQPAGVVLTQPGEWRVEAALREVIAAAGRPLDRREDRHFYCTRERFARHAHGRRQLRMEYFYREMRREHRVLMTPAGQPEGGEWNYDQANRESFGRDGPPIHEAPRAFPPDAITREVLNLVGRRFADHPGDLAAFDWPVTRAEARAALEDFVARRLPEFGRWQDAMWTEEPWLFHSRLAVAMNLKLLNPREVVAATEAAYRAGAVPLAAAEGFIRQILGWREYVRGIYWHHMPAYLEGNALAAHEELPEFYWTGACEMNCLRQTIGQTLRLGYAHHIQRLMVTGLYALLLGVRPRAVHEWYLAVYVDAVEWVELPNTLGMSQYADGGIMASKPYIATGNYIRRMSNYCEGCRFDPARRTGPVACPFTTLYWDFLLRHESRLAGNPRLSLQMRNLARLGTEERAAIQAAARTIRDRGGRPVPA